MKDFVSYRATSLVGAIASMSIICSSFSPYGLPWPVPAWWSLALAAGGLLALRSNPSIRQVLQGVKSGPLLAMATRHGARPPRPSSLPPRETRTR